MDAAPTSCSDNGKAAVDEVTRARGAAADDVGVDVLTLAATGDAPGALAVDVDDARG